MAATPWIEALRPKGGPLVDAAAAFAAKVEPAAFPHGAEALRRLASVVASFTEGELGLTDDQLVEGAGALLGLVLLDQLGRGAHCYDGQRHGIALGEHGYFDPFAAIEAALESDTPRAELARRVREAEDEYAGSGPVARVVRAFREALGSERPEVRIESVRVLSVALADGVEVDLTQVARATDGEPDSAVSAAARKLVSMLPGSSNDPRVSLDEARQRLLPRLVGPRFLAELEARAVEHGARIHGRPLGHGVSVALVLAYAGRARFVREDELARWDIAPEEAEGIALARLASLSANARFARVETPDGPLVVARTGDGLDASRLLLPGLFGVLASALERPLFAAAPHRDVLLASGPGRARDALRARAEDDFARAPHGISPAVFEVTTGGLIPG